MMVILIPLNVYPRIGTNQKIGPMSVEEDSSPVLPVEPPLFVAPVSFLYSLELLVNDSFCGAGVSAQFYVC